MTTMIQSECIQTTSICNGTYGCGSDTEMAVLARVIPVWHDPLDHDESESYEQLTVVRADGTLWISKVPVPCGVPITCSKYWAPYDSKPYIDRVVEEEAQIRMQADKDLFELLKQEQDLRLQMESRVAALERMLQGASHKFDVRDLADAMVSDGGFVRV